MAVVLVGACSQCHYTLRSLLHSVSLPPQSIPFIIHPSLRFSRKLVYFVVADADAIAVAVVVLSPIQHIISSILYVFRVLLPMCVCVCTMRYVERIILSYTFDFRYGFFVGIGFEPFSKWFDPYFLYVCQHIQRGFSGICAKHINPFVLIIMQVTKR